MKYVKKEGKIESTFEVVTDGLDEIFETVMANCCYKVNGEFDLRFCGWSTKIDPKTNQMTEGPTLPNGAFQYVNITKYNYYTYDEHNDSLTITGTKIVAPKLAHILYDILTGEKGSVDELIKYANDPELIPLDERIKQQNKIINGISNTEADEKIAALKELKELIDRKKKNEYADTKKLRSLYRRAKECIKFRLISRTSLYENLVLPYNEVFVPENDEDSPRLG